MTRTLGDPHQIREIDLERKIHSVGSTYSSAWPSSPLWPWWCATMNEPQELLDTAWRHCQAIQTIIDQLTETESNAELRLLSQRLQRLAFHAAPRSRDG